MYGQPDKSFEQFCQEQDEWTNRIRAEHERLGAACPCGNGRDEDDKTP